MDKALFGEDCAEYDWAIDPIYDVPIQDLWKGWYFVAGSPYTYTFNTAAGFVNNHHSSRGGLAPNLNKPPSRAADIAERWPAFYSQASPEVRQRMEERQEQEQRDRRPSSELNLNPDL